MIKFLQISLFLSFTISSAQIEVCGKYRNELGETLTLNQDNTFEYTWNFDLTSSWNIGTCKIENDKYIYLNITEIKDTLHIENKINFVLSNDKISNEITNQEHVINLISGGGQSRKLPSKKLLIRNGKLYTYTKEGKIQSKKQKSLMIGNAYSKPWFEKM